MGEPRGSASFPPGRHLNLVAESDPAKACAEAGNFKSGLTIMLDVEQPLYEVTTLLKTASLLHRSAES
jgi:hypothetical protein